jgi:hypothetical protein
VAVTPAIQLGDPESGGGLDEHGASLTRPRDEVDPLLFWKDRAMPTSKKPQPQPTEEEREREQARRALQTSMDTRQ